MQLWTLPGENPEGTLLYTQTLDSNYFIRAGMSIHKDFYAHGASIKINIDEGDGLFAAKIGQAIPEFADTQYAEVLIELTCGPKISFLGLNDDGSDRLMFDGGEADLQMSMYWKVRTSLFLHSQLRRWHCWCMCIGRCVLKYNITRKLTFLRPNHPLLSSRIIGTKVRLALC